MAEIIKKIANAGKIYSIGGGSTPAGEDNRMEYLTQEEYNALSPEQKADTSVNYVIIGEGTSGSIDAKDVTFTAESSTLTSDNVHDAIEEVFTNVSNGKELLADAITDKGVETSADDTFQEMAEKIGEIKTKTQEQKNIEVSFNSLEGASDGIIFDGESDGTTASNYPVNILDGYKDSTYIHIVARERRSSSSSGLSPLIIRVIVIDETGTYGTTYNTDSYMNNRSGDRTWIEYKDGTFYYFTHGTRTGKTMCHIKFDTATKTFTRDPSEAVSGSGEEVPTSFPERGRIKTNVYSIAEGQGYIKDRITFLEFN